MTQTSMPIRTAVPAPRRRWALLTTGVAAAAVAAVVLALGQGGPSPSDGTKRADAGAVLLAAAEQTGKVTTLRFSQPPSGAAGFSAEGEVSGADWRVVSKGETPGGTTTTVIGDVRYVTTGGSTTKEKIPQGERLAPFARAAGDLTRAVSQDRNVVEVGTEDVRGTRTTHYRLTLPARTSAADPASAVTKLPPDELAWFDLEGIDAYSDPVTLDIWVAGDLVRRIAGTVANQGPLTSVEFYDFNAPVTITAPRQK
ncbi:hypothetical protein [Pseudosporangium ferrugineum]|uniref:Lipoprotein LprG n=1 Tax=Pseudosporangium ferrugineum TaxID=439699 RepID=A0A2T0SBA2_9ACTN|nr:hypothetical protein [Pseudosporangium ferrugineum]PRY30682.1 hypothetical protein CLV70_104234 [Pseudosporangium ferrugineum]